MILTLGAGSVSQLGAMIVENWTARTNLALSQIAKTS